MEEDDVREPVVAGSWYPGSGKALRAAVEGYLANVDKARGAAKPCPEPVALVSPHAGYAFSAQTAAHAYARVRGLRYDAVAVLSPLHRIPAGRYAVTRYSAYRTPLGELPVDRGLVDALARRVPLTRVGYDGEHSLEIQLPFLQVALGEVPLLPVMLGTGDLGEGEAFGRELARVLEGRKALVVASSDMHHIEDFEEVEARDVVVAEALRTFDLARIKEALSARDCSVCGRVPVVAALAAAKELGADALDVIYRTTSAEVTGQRIPGQYTVGYLAAAAYRRGTREGEGAGKAKAKGDAGGKEEKGPAKGKAKR